MVDGYDILNKRQWVTYPISEFTIKVKELFDSLNRETKGKFNWA